MKLYHELAEYYFSIEKENRNIEKDINMIHALLEGRDKPALLDLGCGTGEHLDKLSKLGVNCTGLDSSEEMIKTAKSRFSNSVDFIKANMINYNFINKFDLIISLFGSFDYITGDNDIITVLINTWKALKPNGIGLFEIWNARPLQRIKEKPLTFVSETNHNNTKINRERGFKLLDYPGKTIVEVKYNYIISKHEIIQDTHIMRAFTLKEIEYFLNTTGFEIIALYANSSLEAYNEMSGRIITLFKKKEI
jgi:SAM-dependent methyltransferase